MNRRHALVVLASLPATSRARASVTQLVGILESRPESMNRVSIVAFEQVLASLGHRLGDDVEMMYRSSEGRGERLSALADQLVGSGVDVIVAMGTPAARAAKASTSGRIPVVMAGIGDPVGAGLVKSLGRPGGNMTGVSDASPAICARRLALLKELLPRLRRVAATLDMGEPANASQWRRVQVAARTLRLEPTLLDLRPGQDMSGAFRVAAGAGVQALVIGAEGASRASLGRMAELSLEHRLASIHSGREYPDAGGLMSYGASPTVVYREAAALVSRILRGARPADLPVEPASRLQLVINRRTARLLSIDVPDDLIVRADTIIY